jgi:hypothetical protein
VISENRPSLRKAHTASDGIIGHKLVFVASNKLANCDKEPNSITSLKPDVAASNSTGRETLERPTRLVQVVIVCDIAAPPKSFEPSLVSAASCTTCGFERLSMNSDSRQRSPRQMTTDCCVSLKGANVYGALCRNGLICLACFQRYPLPPAALLYMAVLAQHDCYLH